jgi:hypothetical protein
MLERRDITRRANDWQMPAISSSTLSALLCSSCGSRGDRRARSVASGISRYCRKWLQSAFHRETPQQHPMLIAQHSAPPEILPTRLGQVGRGIHSQSSEPPHSSPHLMQIVRALMNFRSMVLVLVLGTVWPLPVQAFSDADFCSAAKQLAAAAEQDVGVWL